MKKILMLTVCCSHYACAMDWWGKITSTVTSLAKKTLETGLNVAEYAHNINNLRKNLSVDACEELQKKTAEEMQKETSEFIYEDATYIWLKPYSQSVKNEINGYEDELLSLGEKIKNDSRIKLISWLREEDEHWITAIIAPNTKIEDKKRNNGSRIGSHAIITLNPKAYFYEGMQILSSGNIEEEKKKIAEEAEHFLGIKINKSGQNKDKDWYDFYPLWAGTVSGHQSSFDKTESALYSTAYIRKIISGCKDPKNIQVFLENMMEGEKINIEDIQEIHDEIEDQFQLLKHEDESEECEKITEIKEEERNCEGKEDLKESKEKTIKELTPADRYHAHLGRIKEFLSRSEIKDFIKAFLGEFFDEIPIQEEKKEIKEDLSSLKEELKRAFEELQSFTQKAKKESGDKNFYYTPNQTKEMKDVLSLLDKIRDLETNKEINLHTKDHQKKKGTMMPQVDLNREKHREMRKFYKETYKEDQGVEEYLKEIQLGLELSEELDQAYEPKEHPQNIISLTDAYLTAGEEFDGKTLYKHLNIDPKNLVAPRKPDHKSVEGIKKDAMNAFLKKKEAYNAECVTPYPSIPALNREPDKVNRRNFVLNVLKDNKIRFLSQKEGEFSPKH